MSAPKPPPKRKNPPSSSSSGPLRKKPYLSNSAPPYDPRKPTSQPTSTAFQNGEVNVEKFVKAREYEIRALSAGIQKARKGGTRRAFQDVPIELRRRAGAHNVKRVVPRARERAKREMREDNTPTVNSRTRKKGLGGMRRERAGVVRVLRGLSGRVKERKGASEAQSTATVTSRVPKPKSKKNVLKSAPLPPAKFRKRQLNKTWLPTHLYHVKRAHMTPPKEPLWRFAIPLTPTLKGYRATHRAAHARGAVAWDVSYMSTIGLEGREKSIKGILRAMGVGSGDDQNACWGKKGAKWRKGTRTWEGWVYKRNGWPNKPIAPVVVFWCVEHTIRSQQHPEKVKREVMVRVHPSAFLQVWEEVLRLSKVQNPSVKVEDLRFEIGSIEITGPASTEALISVLHPSSSLIGDAPKPESGESDPATVFQSLASISNPSTLPSNSLLAFEVSDPRLHPLQRLPQQSQDSAAQMELLRTIASWPPDRTLSSPTIFDRGTRLTAARTLPSQKSINRRKGATSLGEAPESKPTDPSIPILLYTSSSTSNRSSSGNHQSSWTLLLPWRAVDVVWRCLMHVPLSSGNTPRPGGLNEKRQLLFEAGVPWFPGDFPGTKPGREWEDMERTTKKAEWERRPKGKRTAWESVDVGEGGKGELGLGWACDWDFLFQETTTTTTSAEGTASVTTAAEPRENGDPKNDQDETTANPPTSNTIPENQPPTQLPSHLASKLLDGSESFNKNLHARALVTVRFTLLARGVPQSRARVYRLPSAAETPELRKEWLDLLPSSPASVQRRTQKKNNNGKIRPPPANASKAQQNAYLANMLLHPEPPTPGEEEYPRVPGRGDLVGFVTSGNFNLGEGVGTGLGCLAVAKVVGGGAGDGDGDGRGLCVVRNVGESVGRLARWDVV
ncbi:putative ribonuclease P complex subunit Pop1 [Aulographum hederae CBS 113979]|uniref:Putative ribonuclease P complex subunit Pop1 n=1 Tax=Aulographum hederae CBS 113979 TaxID=1176131 RepID=A0A6G1HF82_9PEZI|nr:putative ribonuclease P complex subunit Pop1 [Aulographum hederae CBS 113979]